LPCSPQWVWGALDPVTKLLLAIEVGARTRALAQCLVHQVVQVLAPDCVPLFLTDGFKEYLRAILTHYGHWVPQPRRWATGSMPKPRWMPLPQLQYAQVIKTTRRRRLVAVRSRVVFGTLATIKQVLAPTGWQINTAFVERSCPSRLRLIDTTQEGKSEKTLCPTSGAASMVHSSLSPLPLSGERRSPAAQ
jgi:hypothetical protein